MNVLPGAVMWCDDGKSKISAFSQTLHIFEPLLVVEFT